MRTRDRINRIFDLYFSMEKIDDQIVKKFRVWFADHGHLKEKYAALEYVYGKYMGFDANPSRKVLKSYDRIRRRLGFDTPSPKPVPLIFRWFARVAAMITPFL